MSQPDYESIPAHKHVHRAQDLARVVHMGQPDKGSPDLGYISHPLRVYLGVCKGSPRHEQFRDAIVEYGEEDDLHHMRTAAWLHDAVEDTALTIGDLLKYGFPTRAINLVSVLTHRKDAEPRRLYLARIRRDPAALAIKAADQDDNTDPRRLDAYERLHGLDERLRLEDKYQRGYAILGIEPLPDRPRLRYLPGAERRKRGLHDER